jgi:streptogramin lyase
MHLLEPLLATCVVIGLSIPQPRCRAADQGSARTADLTAEAEVHIYGADHTTGEVVKFKEDGTKLWSFPNRNSHDVQVLPNGNVLINPGTVQEVAPDGTIVWEVGKPAVQNPESCQRLPNGNTVIADNAAHAVVEVSPDKQVVWKYDVPGNPSMRQVRRLDNGNTLICASSQHVVLEVNPAKEIVWRYELPFPYLAQRLENGDTLISSGAGAGKKGYFLIEVDPAGKTVWKYGGDGAAAEEQLDWPSGFVRRPDGTIYVSECRSARIRVISPDRKTFRFITSPAMKHAATIAVVEAAESRTP